MNFKNIYINGCSITYGDGLDVKEYDQNNHEWWEKRGKPIGNYSEILSKEYQVPVIDESRLGGSNDRILRKTIDFILNSEDLSDTLFLIQWTYPLRYERLISGKWYQVILDEKHFVNNNPDDIKQAIHYAKLAGVLFEDDDGLLDEDMMIQMYLKKIRCIILLQSIFEKYGIKYLMYNGHDYYGSEVGFEYPDFLRVVSVRQNNSITSKLHLNLIEKIDNSFFLSKQVVDIFGENQIQNYYKGHGDKKGHKIFADYLIKEINKI